MEQLPNPEPRQTSIHHQRDINKAIDALGIDCIGVHRPSFTAYISKKYQLIFRRHIERISESIMNQNIQTKEVGNSSRSKFIKRFWIILRMQDKQRSKAAYSALRPFVT
ncbi:hypothetical protein A1359_03435 [Methylomonas lenta]|uniref:Uncharacterized protein n=1 Tax=Methylomonas lenta TaxID=980561 RepID=A0A177NPS5_9GAMM|nr:hypothetical protein A1359_03435 [Methylomonas lenta]